MKKLLLLISLWIGALILWIFVVLIPYTKEIITHIESVTNNGTDLSLLLILKYLLYIIGYWIVLRVLVWIIALFIVSHD